MSSQGNLSLAVPSTPDPVIVALILRLLRAVLTIAGAFGMTIGPTLNNDSTLTVIAGALAVIGSIVWTIIEWIMNARHTHAVAVMSATAGAPVKPA